MLLGGRSMLDVGFMRDSIQLYHNCCTYVVMSTHSAGLLYAFIILLAAPLCAGAPPQINGLHSRLTGRVYTSFSCTACEIVATVAIDLLARHVSDDHIAEYATKICIDFAIEDTTVCTLAVQEFHEEVLFVLKRVALPAKDVCAFVFGDICSTATADPEVSWNVTLPNVPKPPVQPPRVPSAGMPVLRILHLSDIHVDLQYAPGSNANCGEPLCCRAGSSIPVAPADKAGTWGDYRNCDLPLWTLQNLFQHLSDSEKFDVIYWTGDLPPHDVWKQTRKSQLKVLSVVKDLMLKYFPNVPIFSALGNHESAPVNSFPPPFIQGNDSVAWLYQALEETWLHWLPNTTGPTIKKGAYYTVLLKAGYRLISVNTNYCDRRNWWLLLNATDPTEELAWLAGILQSSEDTGEKVHIIGHIPPGDPDCYSVWSRNYHKVVNRYENVVVGQFFGHTHNDQFAVFYDEKERGRAFSVAYIAPSITTYTGLNGGYRIYTVDGSYEASTWRVLDYETYILNVTKANLDDKTTWELEYIASKAFSMPDLLPQSWDDLVAKMRHSMELFSTYYRFFFKSNLPTLPCDSSCVSQMLCSLKTTIYKENIDC